MQKFCAQCGSALATNARFCVGCGAETGVGVVPAVAIGKRPGLLWGSAVGLLLVLTGIAAAFWYQVRSTESEADIGSGDYAYLDNAHFIAIVDRQINLYAANLRGSPSDLLIEREASSFCDKESANSPCGVLVLTPGKALDEAIKAILFGERPQEFQPYLKRMAKENTVVVTYVRGSDGNPTSYKTHLNCNIMPISTPRDHVFCMDLDE